MTEIKFGNDSKIVDTNLYRVAPGHLIMGPLIPDAETLREWDARGAVHPPATLREWYAQGVIDLDGLQIRLDAYFAKL